MKRGALRNVRTEHTSSQSQDLPISYAMRSIVACFSFALLFAAAPTLAAPIKPRFVLIVDTSGSMSMTVGGTETRGDGSLRHPGCDINGDGVYDDSRIAQAKGALTDTIAAFGSAEFALARYKATDGSLQCNNNATCTAAFGSNWSCADPTHIAGTQKYCMKADRGGCSNNGQCYSECVPKSNGGYTCPANFFMDRR